MKYLKIFENKTLDDILDKISRSGMSSLTELEKEFLDKYSRGEHKEVEQKIKEKLNKVKSFIDYDPRKDNDFYKEMGDDNGLNMDFSNWSNEDIEEGRCEILWEQMYDEDMNNFLGKYNLPAELREKPWDKLPQYIQKYFKQFIKDIGMFD